MIEIKGKIEILVIDWCGIHDTVTGGEILGYLINANFKLDSKKKQSPVINASGIQGL